MANKKHSLKALFKHVADPRDMDDLMADGVDTPEYFSFAFNPDEPELSGERTLGTRFRLSLSNRHHLKKLVWNSGMKKLRVH